MYVLARFELVVCPAIRTDAFTGVGNVDVNPGMHRPQGGIGPWTINRQIAGAHHNDVGVWFCRSVSTAHGVSWLKFVIQIVPTGNDSIMNLVMLPVFV